MSILPRLNLRIFIRRGTGLADLLVNDDVKNEADEQANRDDGEAPLLDAP